MARPEMPPAVPDPHSPTPAPDPTPGSQRWGRVYAFVLAVLALLITIFAWLTRVYS
jgi:hypothetical protein